MTLNIWIFEAWWWACCQRERRWTKHWRKVEKIKKTTTWRLRDEGSCVSWTRKVETWSAKSSEQSYGGNGRIWKKKANSTTMAFRSMMFRRRRHLQRRHQLTMAVWGRMRFERRQIATVTKDLDSDLLFSHGGSSFKEQGKRKEGSSRWMWVWKRDDDRDTLIPEASHWRLRIIKEGRDTVEALGERNCYKKWKKADLGREVGVIRCSAINQQEHVGFHSSCFLQLWMDQDSKLEMTLHFSSSSHYRIPCPKWS